MFNQIRYAFVFIFNLVLVQLAYAQTVLIDSLAGGGFELGSTPAANGWTAVNGTTNVWMVGISGPLAGTRCAYISSNGSSPYYNTGVAAVSHLYQDITIPSGGNFGLKFYYRCEGEVNNDVLKVYLIPTSVTPVANTLLSTGQIGINQYWNSASWKAVYINPGSAFNGTTQRLVFTWTNNASSGTQPSVCLDKISLVQYVPLSGMKTIIRTLPTTGDNFTSFTDAINALNLKGVDTGGVTFSVPAGQSFNEQAPPITSTGAAGSQVIFSKTGTGTNPVIHSAGIYRDAGIALWGGDYFTFDGIDIAVTNNPSQVWQGYLIRQASEFNGAHHNTIRNCTISLNNHSLDFFGIYQYMVVNPASQEGTNSHNHYYNITIQNCKTGIRLAGISTTFPDDSCRIGIPGAQTVTIGDLYTFGIYCTYQKNLSITGVEVKNISSSAAGAGIQVSYPSGKNLISHCRVHDITNTASVGSVSLEGIKLGCTGDPATTFDICNSFVYNLFYPNHYSTTGIRAPRGIRVEGTTGGTVNIYHNSIRIPGNAQNNTSCFDVNANPNILLTVRNNIFYNAFPSQATYNQYCFASDVAGSIGAAGSVSDYNVFYHSGAGTSYTGLGNITKYQSLSYWQTAMNQDQHSLFINPGFISPSDLHIIPYNPSILESAGTTAVTASADIDYDSRPGPPGSVAGGPFGPDIGADEFDGIPPALDGPDISYTAIPEQFFYSPQVFTALATITGPNGVATAPGKKPRIYFKNHSEINAYNGNTSADQGWKWTEATNSNSPFSFSIDYSLLYAQPALGDTIDYFIVAQDTSPIPRVSVNSGLLSYYPGSVGLTTACFPVFSNINYYRIKVTLNGVVTVGTGGVFASLTGTGGLFDVIKKGGITGNVTAKIVSDLNESAAVALDQFISLGGNWNLSIVPDTCVVYTVSGASSVGLIRLDRADRVIIDGSYNNKGRYLRFVNTYTTGNFATIQLINPGSGQGATNIAIRNCHISTGSRTLGSVAIYAGGPLVNNSGMNNDSIEIFNNWIFNAYRGIYINSDDDGYDDHVVIRNNLIGHDIPSRSITSDGILVNGVNGMTIDHNEIMNVVNSANTINICGLHLGDFVVNSTITHNMIHGIRNTNTKGAYGMQIQGVVNNGNTFIGNTVSDIVTANNATGSIWSAIGVLAGNTTNFNFYYNSICLSGQQISSTNGYLTSALYTPGNIQGWNIRNNLFVNTMTSSFTDARNYAVYMVSTFGTVMDYNNYFVSGQPNILANIMGDITTLAGLQAATGQDQHSMSLDPGFNSHVLLAPMPGSPVLNTGIPIPGVDVDITGTPRSLINPTPGAYEEGKDRLPPQISYVPLPASFNKDSNDLVDYVSIEDTSGIDTAYLYRPRLYYKKKLSANIFVENNNSTDGWKYAEGIKTGQKYTFSIDYSRLPAAPAGGSAAGSVNANDTIEYFLLACDASPLHNLAISPCRLNEEASATLLQAIHFPVDNPSFYRIFDTIQAFLTVGTGGDYPNLSGSGGLFAALKSVSFIRDVNVKIISNITEPGTYPLEQVTSEGGKWRLSIAPASATPYNISGGSNGGVIRLFGADRITIDGSFQGSGSYLNIIHTGYAGYEIGVEVNGLGAGSGATHNVIRNCNISGPNKSHASSYGIKFSGSSPAANSISNDSNIVENNVITRFFYGIHAVGGDNQNSNYYLTVRNNTIGSDIDANSIGFLGIALRGLNRAVVEKNHIFNIKASSQYPTGILVSRYVVNSLIKGNKIHNIKYTGTSGYTGYGIEMRLYLANCNDTVACNMIWDIGGDSYSSFGDGAIAGMAINDYSGGISIYYNIIYLSGTYAGNSNGNLSAALFINGASTNLDIRNNILVSTLVNSNCPAHHTYSVFSQNPASNFVTMDNNVYAVGGSQGMLAYQGTNRPDLASLQAGFGQNLQSMAFMPVFFSLATGEPCPDTTVNCRLDGTADPITGIRTDIYGNTRDVLHPDIGAVEFSPAPAFPAQASSNSPAIFGDTLFLYASPSGMVSYAWSGPYFFSSSLQNPILTNANSGYNGLFSVTIKDTANCTSTDTVEVVVMQPNSTQGTIMYLNPQKTPMKGVKTFLLNDLNQAVDSVLTDSAGTFMFQGIPNGNYQVKLNFPQNWAGSNAVDALLVLRYFVGMTQLSGLNLLAANVDLNPPVTANDALQIMRRFVGYIGTFPLPDWIQDQAAFSISDDAAVIHINCICRGDINGSHEP